MQTTGFLVNLAAEDSFAIATDREILESLA